MAPLLEETWFIAVLAAIGAVVLILIIVIILLCCLWRKQRKENQQNGYHASTNNVEQGKDYAPSNELSNSQNWVLVYPGDKVSAPASSDTTARVIRGNDPVLAGSSLIHMNREIRGSMHTQSSIPLSHEKGRYNEAIDLGDPGYGSEYSSRTEESRESQVRKPRIANISVSSSRKESHTNYNNAQNTAMGSSAVRTTSVGSSVVSSVGSPFGSPVGSPQYIIPQPDYNNAPNFSYYNEETSWQSSYANDHAHNTKVKGIASAFENPKENSPLSSPTRTAVEIELIELQQTAPIKKRLSQRNSGSHVVVQKRVSNQLEDITDDEHDNDAWKRNTGKHTIETRLKRYKKAGAMSVFPD